MASCGDYNRDDYNREEEEEEAAATIIGGGGVSPKRCAAGERESPLQARSRYLARSLAAVQVELFTGQSVSFSSRSPFDTHPASPGEACA